MSIFEKAKPKRVTRAIPKIDTDKIAQDTLKGATDRLHRDLEGTALRMLGFVKDSRAGWAIDHCNARMSLVTELLKHRAKEIFAHMNLEQVFTLSDEEGRQLRDGVRKEFLKQAEYEIRVGHKQIIQLAVQKMVQEEVEAYIQETGARENVRKWVRAALGGECCEEDS